MYNSAQSIGVIEYTDYIFAEGKGPPPNDYPVYNA